MKRLFFAFAAFLFLASGNPSRAQDNVSSRPFDLEKDSVSIPFEFRGAWLSTVESIDWPKVKIELSTKDKGKIAR